jgi:hypothetical protein
MSRYLDQAEATSTIRFHRLIVTEVGDLNARIESDFENAPTLFSLNELTIDLKGNHHLPPASAHGHCVRGHQAIEE